MVSAERWARFAGGLFEAQFEAHHEVDPGCRVLFECIQDRSRASTIDLVLLEDLVDLFFFVMGTLDDLAFFADLFGGVMFGVPPCGEIAAEAHGDGSCSNLGKTGEDDDLRRGNSSGEACSERKRNGETVGESNDDVTNGVGGFEVSFDVGLVGMRSVGYIMHGR